jgi:predicted alpha-1,2-mannosidase
MSEWCRYIHGRSSSWSLARSEDTVEMTRRGFIAAVTASYIAQTRAFPQPHGEDGSGDILQFVDPMIGTGGYGHCFPGATVPFGAVQLGPDTGDHEWKHCSGYHYDDRRILGFSHTHLSGTGVGDMQDFRFMPAYSDEIDVSDPRSFSAEFSHANETAEVGYYGVKLLNPKISVELTATERAGLHRYHFAGGKACLLVDLSNVWRLDKAAEGEPGLVDWARLKVDGDTFSASRSTAAWAKGREIHAYVQFSKSPSHCDLVVDSLKLASGVEEASGKAVHAVFSFDDLPSGILEARVGISAVDTSGAKNNLLIEMRSMAFETVKRAARQRWATALGRVRVEQGGGRRERRIFYTGLYHSMLAPTLFDDVDRRYRGMDGKVHSLAPGEQNYSTFSAWDTYRALHPLFTLIRPEMVPSICNCIIRQSLESPDGATVWPLQGKETGCMDGYHTVAIVAEGLVKGFQGIDVAGAYKVYRKRAEEDDYRGLTEYRKFGYVPCDLVEQSASRTCNYAYDDHCIAAIAEKAGDHAEADRLRARSLSYRHLYERESGFIRPRLKDGSWAEPFDPKAITITKRWRDYEEANGWQTTFLAQHDPEGLVELFGGKQAMVAKLDGLFNASSDLPTEMMPPDVTGLIGQYCHGNEPSHHIVFLYNIAGAPHKAQARLQQIWAELYHDAPDALAGNEDCGQMSAWFCMTALGIYPIDPVSGRYQIGTPLFDKVVVEMAPGRLLTVIAKRQSAKSVYVVSVAFNGEAIHDLSISHAALSGGGTLLFMLGDGPTSNSV